MMQIARFRVEHMDECVETKSGPTKEEQMWDYVLDNYKKWENEDVKPLYLTNRGVYRDISLVVSSRSADAFADYILNHMAPLDSIRDIWVFNMMDTRLFSIPANLSQNLKRFTITLNVVPGEAPFIFDFISKIKPSAEILITYITYIYHRHGDILISLLAGDKSVAEDFVRRYIGSMKGVIRTEIIPIIKSKNLANSEEWRDNCGQYFDIKNGRDVGDLEVYESWWKIGFE
ncbi:MAG: hypothetical protein JSV56_06160 [Methanomassiliicoccales archaeon]|nr:MAG: hypothetical protein JSV56_06160 [Methanomassiliicoccales archaeon]